MVLAVRTGAAVPLDWDDDQVIWTAFEVLGEETQPGKRRRRVVAGE